MIFESDEEGETKIQMGSAASEEAYIFGDSAPEYFNLTDGDSNKIKEIHF